MNEKTIDQAIAIMARAKKFNMMEYQLRLDREDGIEFVQTEEELHANDSAADFAGYVAISPEWKAAGGLCERGRPFIAPKSGPGAVFPGAMHLPLLYGHWAIAQWLEINYVLAHKLIDGDTTFIGSGGLYSHFYDMFVDKITPSDVIFKLEAIKSGGYK